MTSELLAPITHEGNAYDPKIVLRMVYEFNEGIPEEEARKRTDVVTKIHNRTIRGGKIGSTFDELASMAKELFKVFGKEYRPWLQRYLHLSYRLSCEIMDKINSESMNIYLDIDDVILGVESPIEDLVRFITYILDRFSDSTYWLTTHCNYGENHTDHVFRGVYSDELVDRMMNAIKPTDWGSSKTNAIDFTKPFIWFDDDPSEYDMEVLKRQSTTDSLFMMSSRDVGMAREALAHMSRLSA